MEEIVLFMIRGWNGFTIKKKYFSLKQTLTNENVRIGIVDG